MQIQFTQKGIEAITRQMKINSANMGQRHKQAKQLQLEKFFREVKWPPELKFQLAELTSIITGMPTITLNDKAVAGFPPILSVGLLRSEKGDIVCPQTPVLFITSNGDGLIPDLSGVTTVWRLGYATSNEVSLVTDADLLPVQLWRPIDLPAKFDNPGHTILTAMQLLELAEYIVRSPATPPKATEAVPPKLDETGQAIEKSKNFPA